MNYDFDYMNAITSLQQEAYKVNYDNLKVLAEKFADNMINDGIIYFFGTGHSDLIGIEVFSRAGGVANICPMIDPNTSVTFGSHRSGQMERLSGISDVIFDDYHPTNKDIVVISSNSGRNHMPIEMALRCKKEGIYTVALTSLKQSKTLTSRHSSGLKLYEICDLTIDNCALEGDTCFNIDKYSLGPTSNIMGFFLMHSAICEAVKIVISKGHKPYVFQSQNIDKDNSESRAAHQHYKSRIPLL